jgi:hypothetical protein
MSTWMRAVRGVLPVICMLPVVAQAQTSVKSSMSEWALTRALQFHDSAVALYSQPRRAAQAARLHLKEVNFRAKGDPEAVEALVMAANLFNYAHQPISARRIMEDAADRALATGDVVVAAQAYTNAAFLAQKVGNVDEMKRLARKAILLSDSPLLMPEQRQDIRNRFRVSPTFAELLK